MAALALLPDDVLADVLRRLAPRDLAVSRSVCEAWRAVVDGRCALREEAELLPLWLAGLLIKYNWAYPTTEFFARPSRRTTIPGGRRDFMAEGEIGSWFTVLDHCNGLLLTDGDEDDYDLRVLSVINPATRRRARLPPYPPLRVEQEFDQVYLAYDPADSPHYHVFLFPYLLHSGHEVDPDIEQSEWPPATYDLHVFSSVTGQWEERSFVREAEAAGITTVADMRKSWHHQYNGVYRRGQLYVHCQPDFVMRISLSSDKYHVIKQPAGRTQVYLGKSKKGIYCASFPESFRLQVWILDESSSPMEWVLKHDRDLRQFLMKNKLGLPLCRNRNNGKLRGPWILQDINYNHEKNIKMKALVRKKFVWSSDASDDDDETASKCKVDSEHTNFYCGHFDILGFHPYKEIIFLSQSIERGIAYHLNSSTIQDLGNIYPQDYDSQLSNERIIESSFPYTPCWIEQFGDGLT